MFVKLFDLMLSSFQGKEYYVTCDSAYRDDIMALIAENILQINNMVGIMHFNYTTSVPIKEDA